MAKLSPYGPFRAFDSNGDPLNGGKLYTYDAGTTTPKTTYTTEAATIANANPVILDADGYANVWLGDGSYKFVLKTSADVTIWTVDNIIGDQSTGFVSSIVNQATSLNVSTIYQNNLINATAAITLTLLAAATAGANFYFTVKATGGAVTIDPDGAELIDGAATKTIPLGASAAVICTGTAWITLFLPSGDFSSGTLILPQGSYQELNLHQFQSGQLLLHQKQLRTRRIYSNE